MNKSARLPLPLSLGVLRGKDRRAVKPLKEEDVLQTFRKSRQEPEQRAARIDAHDYISIAQVNGLLVSHDLSHSPCDARNLFGGWFVCGFMNPYRVIYFYRACGLAKAEGLPTIACPYQRVALLD